MENRRDAADGPAWETRYDRGSLLRSSVHPGSGALLAEGIAQLETVLVYRKADGTTVRELVTADAIRSGAEGLSRAPVTLGHPPENVDPQNYADYAVGDVDGEVEIANGGFTKIRVAVRDQKAIRAVRDGTVELSCGYRCEIDPTPGEHPVHGKFDARQVRRETNHVAIVPRGRAGPDARLRADAAESTTSFRDDTAPPSTKRKSMNVRLAAILAALGISTRFDSDDGALDALSDALKSRKDAADTVERTRADEHAATVRDRDTAKQRADAAERDRDTQKARADAAEAELTRLRTEAKTRADADEAAALAPLCARHRVDGKLDLVAKKRAIAAAHLGKELRADATDAYVDALVDLAKEDLAKGRTAGAKAHTAGARTDARDPVRPPVLKSANDRHAEAVAKARKAQGIG